MRGKNVGIRKRAAGILMPISSLPSEYGIGCFSKEAYDFVDKLKESGQTYWQILPLGPTGYGDSPYQSFSTFAGNPYFIDPETLIEEELLTKKECDSFDFVSHPNYVEYEKIYKSRFKLLKLAHERFKTKECPEYLQFCSEQAFWLDNYALYMAIKDSKGSVCWREWEDDIRLHHHDTVERYKNELHEEFCFYQFQQYEFFKQWDKLKKYANENGIYIIGDLPIYVALDSADAWAEPALFQMDENGEPTRVAGCPPDAFTELGQLWGNPLYNWEYHENTGYGWWISRIRNCLRLYDIVRIDHFRGFDEYYSIPADAENAKIGRWEKGPGMKLFYKLREVLGDVNIIAEDLGFLTQSVIDLLNESGYPGMKVLQFAFDESGTSGYLPHNYTNNCVVYTGTHDNATTEGWYWSLTEKEKAIVNEYLAYEPRYDGRISTRLIRTAMLCPADMAIIPIQDYLALGNEARCNTPSTLGDNWKWRCSKDFFTDELIKQVRRVTELYGRCDILRPEVSSEVSVSDDEVQEEK